MMLRRSSSASNIPIFKTFRSGKRSQSQSRLNQGDSGSSDLPRSTSLERKSSTTGLITPLHRGSVRSTNLLRVTPVSVVSQGSSNSRATTPSSCLKNRVTIQKLSSDKRWVAEQYIKVQNFIMTSGLFDLGVVNDSNIKPPSINNFIYATGILLTEIFTRCNLSKENYKEVIPAKLKVLHYPGTVTTSTLKTVNTMHSWPQIIGMWSWLIDKVNFLKNCNDQHFMNFSDPEEKLKYSLKQNCRDFFIKRYKIFNEFKDEPTEEVDKVNKCYINNLAELLEVDMQQLQILKDDVEKKEKYRKNQKQEIDKLNARTVKMQEEIDVTKRDIEEFQINEPTMKAELDHKLQIWQSNLKDQREAIESLKENIQQLQEAIKIQPCTYQQKLKLLKEMEELEMEVQIKREKIEYAREIKSKFDYKLTTEISKIRSLVIQWNRSLMEVSMERPQLKNLMLREKGFHDPAFLDELNHVYDNKVAIEREVASSLANIQSRLIEQEQKKCEIEETVRQYEEIIAQTNKECSYTAEEIVNIEKKIKNILADLESKKVSHTREIKMLQNENRVQNLLETIADLKTKKEKLNVEVKNFGPKMLSFFVEMHKQVVTNQNEMRGIMNCLAQRKVENMQDILKKQNDVIKTLKHFKE